MSDVERFAELFEGRRDAYGTEEGGCYRPSDNVPNWEGYCQAHLVGALPMGVYPMVPTNVVGDCEGPPPTLWRVKWGCVDLDIKAPGKSRYDFVSGMEAMVAGVNLVTALHALSLTGHIERTRSGGIHVWVFSAGWVQAATMRRALLVACSVAGVPTTEVNPKSEGFDDPDTLGNYVRLPYPGGAPAYSGGRTMVRDIRVEQYEGEDSPGVQWTLVGLHEFLRTALETRAPLGVLQEAAALYTPPASHHEQTIEITGEVVLDQALMDRLGGLAFTILHEGPREGGDRSGALFALASSCQRDGLTPDEALAVVSAADLSWGKYHARRDGERYLRQTVERAFST